MSNLEVNNISKYNGNNISLNDPLRLKNYTTSQIGDLTGMVAGDIVYDSDIGTIKVYNGTDWAAMSSNTFQFTLSWLVIGGGGGGGGQHGGGGGAGGYRIAYSSDVSGGSGSESTITVTPGTNYSVSIGAGGPALQGGGTSEWASNGNSGSPTTFGSITSLGGGAGGNWSAHVGLAGGSGGGGASHNAVGGSGDSNQGHDGGRGSNVSNHFAGGGGGAGAAGADGADNNAGDGGDGRSSTITGSAVYRAGGGGGGAYKGSGQTYSSSYAGSGGAGGGGVGAMNAGGQNETSSATAGTVNTGSGGGGSATYSSSHSSGAGGSGVVILRYPSTFTLNFASGGTLQYVNSTVNTDTITKITQGAGTVYWS